MSIEEKAEKIKGMTEGLTDEQADKVECFIAGMRAMAAGMPAKQEPEKQEASA